MNSVKTVTAEDTETSFNDITIQVKKRCAEIALDKIWLTALKAWEIVRDELVGKIANEVVIPKSDQV